ncbi:hypothetical protein DWX41_04095 [Hungatella hathewayi]|uniref:Uncharacterized protein n=1 Tax=Hungatella hathewayi TaxID=154046 RepID=A0A3E2X0N3_9FIRM|nr:hypothetical protein DWX41_04095 [Hungatella hathewayi]
MGTLNDRDAGVGLGLYMPVRNAPVLLSASSISLRHIQPQSHPGIPVIKLAHPAGNKKPVPRLESQTGVTDVYRLCI